MNMKKIFMGMIAGLFVLSCSHKQTAEVTTPIEVQGVAQDAYIYGYPLVISAVTRDVTTSYGTSTQKGAPINQLSHKRMFPDASFTDVVSPNVDTLYSSASLDLSKEPVVLHVPNSDGRYYVVQLMDAWTNVFAAPGTRTTGSVSADYAIIGPQWTGSLPGTVRQIRAPTNNVTLIGRTQTNGKADYAAVHKFQDQFKLVPLSHYGDNNYVPPINTEVAKDVNRSAPVAQVAQMNAGTFYTIMAEEMIKNPPAYSDSKMVDKLKKMGITPGQIFDQNSISDANRQAIQAGYRAGQEQLNAESKVPHGDIVNGWMVPKVIGTYGTNYLERAVISKNAWGANLKDDAVYPMASTDMTGQQLSGKNKYTIRFAKDQLPPVRAFWSVTAYNSRHLFSKNPINRYAVSDREALKKNADGSITLYLQNKSPGKAMQANWLPVPADDFNLMMRLYYPKQAILDGDWKMPPIQRTPTGSKSLSQESRKNIHEDTAMSD